MRKALIGFTMCTLALGFAGCKNDSGGGAKADPRENLDTAIDDAIKLVEAKEYFNFAEKYIMTPDMEKEMPEKAREEYKAAKDDPAKRKELEAKMEKNFGAEMLDGLKQMKGQKPVMSENDTVATYKVKEKNREEEVKWKKNGKNWILSMH